LLHHALAAEEIPMQMREMNICERVAELLLCENSLRKIGLSVEESYAAFAVFDVFEGVEAAFAILCQNYSIFVSN
jgi:hypothetical protein